MLKVANEFNLTIRALNQDLDKCDDALIAARNPVYQRSPETYVRASRALLEIREGLRKLADVAEDISML